MVIHFLDTSCILNGGLHNYYHAYVSPLTLMELEEIKSANNKSETIKFMARQAIRDIISSQEIQYSFISREQVNKVIKKFDFLPDNHDAQILAEAEWLGRNSCESIHFVTSDGAQYLFAQQMPHIVAEYYSNNDIQDVNESEYCGWSKHYPDEEQLNMLYSDRKMNILNCKTNEFAEIYVGTDLKDILFWDGNEYRNLKYKEFVAPTGDRIIPRNIEQKMYLDLLQNDKIPIKLCIGNFGTGKSMFAETWAANQLTAGRYDRIVFVKNNLDVKGAGKLGTLPGDEIAKQLPWLKQIEDHLGPQLFDEYLNDGRLEPAHLSTLRGRDLKNCIILVDEAENLLVTNIQLLLGRVASNSQIIFCADVKQCDYKDNSMSGIPKMIERLSGNQLFGMVKLIKSERSVVSQCADLLD